LAKVRLKDQHASYCWALGRPGGNSAPLNTPGLNDRPHSSHTQGGSACKLTIVLASGPRHDFQVGPGVTIQKRWLISKVRED